MPRDGDASTCLNAYLTLSDSLSDFPSPSPLVRPIRSVRRANATSMTSRTDRHGSFWYELCTYRPRMADPGIECQTCVAKVSDDERRPMMGRRMGEMSEGELPDAELLSEGAEAMAEVCTWKARERVEIVRTRPRPTSQQRSQRCGVECT